MLTLLACLAFVLVVKRPWKLAYSNSRKLYDVDDWQVFPSSFQAIFINLFLSLTSNHNIWVLKVPIIEGEIHTLSLWIQEFRCTLCCCLQVAFHQPNLLTNFAFAFVVFTCTQNYKLHSIFFWDSCTLKLHRM